MDHPVLLAAYTRAEAIAHGLLVDVTAEAAPLGFTLPVALTWPAWRACVEWTPASQLGEVRPSQLGRLRAVLAHCVTTIQQSAACHRFQSAVATDDPGVTFTIDSPSGRAGRPHQLALKAVFADSGDGGKAITVMLPDEY